MKGYTVLLTVPLCPSDMCEGLEDFQVGFGIFSKVREGQVASLSVCILGGSNCFRVTMGTMALDAVPAQTWPLAFGVPLGSSRGFSMSS